MNQDVLQGQDRRKQRRDVSADPVGKVAGGEAAVRGCQMWTVRSANGPQRVVARSRDAGDRGVELIGADEVRIGLGQAVDPAPVFETIRPESTAWSI